MEQTAESNPNTLTPIDEHVKSILDGLFADHMTRLKTEEAKSLTKSLLDTLSKSEIIYLYGLLVANLNAHATIILDNLEVFSEAVESLPIAELVNSLPANVLLNNRAKLVEYGADIGAINEIINNSYLKGLA